MKGGSKLLGFGRGIGNGSAFTTREGILRILQIRYLSDIKVLFECYGELRLAGSKCSLACSVVEASWAPRH